MGLDTTHGCWHGPYSAFAIWRNRLAYVANWAGNGGNENIDFKSESLKVDGISVHWHDVSYNIPPERIPDQEPLPDEEYTVDGETYTIRWSESYDNSVWLGHWDKDPDDVLDVLFVHSDCEGKIFHRFCYPLAIRLTEVAMLFPCEAGDEMGWHTRARALQFAHGLLLADAAGEDVEFH